MSRLSGFASFPFCFRLVFFVLFFAFLLIVDQSAAQNLKKVERKLEDLVDRGHLMPRHADAMLKTLHEMMEEEEGAWEEGIHEDEEHEHHHGVEEKRELMQQKVKHLEMEATEIEAKIKQAVESGELSREHAEEKMREVKQGLYDAHRELAEMKGRQLETRLKEAVENGKISKEDAHKKMEAFRREIKKKFEGAGDKHRVGGDTGLSQKRKELIAGVKKRLEIALDRGDITEQQAKKRMEGLMQRFRHEDEQRAKAEKK